MLAHKMEITDALISEAERLLLPAGSIFDEERRNFIKRLDACDLLAVPGSGKTTDLQAKLYCLAQQLPLPEGAGIVVLSHTNVAVEELSDKLRRTCPQLFCYPNFVGTMQDFVDTFLALPYYRMLFGHGIEIIDDDRYNEAIDNHHYFKTKFDKNPTLAILFKRGSFTDLRFSLDKQHKCCITVGQDGKRYNIKAPHKWIKEGNAEEKEKEVIMNLKSMKKKVMEKGVLCYDDCYFLSQVYLTKYPKVKDILRKRFPYVFIDETQDMRGFQLSLIDEIFNGDSVSLQRIGDINQSIFSHGTKDSKCEWTPRNICCINRSLRLTSRIANVVDCFTFDKGIDDTGNAQFVVSGGRSIENGDIPPYLILYTIATKDQLKGKFEEIISSHNLLETMEGRKYGFHIVGWNANATGDTNKLHLEDIFTNYSHKIDSIKIDRSTLSSHIQTGAKTGDTKSCYHLVLDIICHVLGLKKKKRTNGRFYTPKTLASDLQNIELSKRDKINKMILKITKHLVCTEYEAAYVTMKHALYRVLQCPTEYTGDAFTPIVSTIAVQTEQSDTRNIEISTVHAAKGQTHCATMYVETWYEGKYECEHVKKTTKKKGTETTHSPFFGEAFVDNGVRSIQAAKMLYVGLSRPTHLLCYASISSLWNDEAIQKMSQQGWQIVELN